MSAESYEERCLRADKPSYCSFQPTPEPMDVSRFKQRLVILDGANLLHITKNAIPGASLPHKKDGLILLQLANYFDYYGFKIRICLRSDYIHHASNPDVLRELVSLGYAFISPNHDKEDDDRAALDMAYDIGAVIITNDKYRNHHGYGFSVRDKLCPISIINPDRKKDEWPHFMFMRPLEHFYFVNPEREIYYRGPMETEQLHTYNPISSNRLRNLFKFVCGIAWFQQKGEWSSEFRKEAYRLPINCDYIRENERYDKPFVYFRPDKIDLSIANRNGFPA